MLSKSKTIRKEDEVSLKLGEIFASYGYKKYSMSRFEEYSLYMENKNFLLSDKIITFTASDGRLMALKPDVTLSIVKNAKAEKGVEKLYYIENVYRPARNSGEFREFEQIGLEAIGDIDEYTTYEVIKLALEALSTVDNEFILDISHVGFVSALIEEMTLDYENAKEVYGYITSKNAHGMSSFVERVGLNEKYAEALKTLIESSGTLGEVIAKIKPVTFNEGMSSALKELESLEKALRGSKYYDKVKLDFSFVNDKGYYNGIAFIGFTPSVPRPIVSGGRYDKLLRKFDKNCGAIGFAVYMDEISLYYPRRADFDQDVFVLYEAGADVAALDAEIDKLRDMGLSVLTGNAMPEERRYNRVMRFDGNRLTEVKEDA